MENSNLIKALIQAQSEFPAIKKDTENPFYHSQYATLDGVLNQVSSVLRKNGLVVVQSFDGMALKTTLWHTSGESISGTQSLVMEKQNAQGLASASTYARRYGLLAILGIAAEDDDGNGAADVKPQQPKPQGAAQPKAAAAPQVAKPAPGTFTVAVVEKLCLEHNYLFSDLKTWLAKKFPEEKKSGMSFGRLLAEHKDEITEQIIEQLPF